MSEKRFELVSVCGDFGIIDTITDDVWFFETYESVVKVGDLLNEQQAIINNQEQKIKILQQEMNDTQAILEMLTEKLKGWK